MSQAEKRIRRVLREPDQGLLAEIKEKRWTAHNIPLSLKESTLGASLPLIGDDARTKAVKAVLRLILGDLRGRRLLDLGSLEGGIALEMAREDMEVLGVEGRKENYEKCLLVKRYFGLPNLNFIQRDVKHLRPEEIGTFDVILCLGLLYHLDDPVGFLGLLASLTHEKGLLFLDTHVAPPDEEALRDCTFSQDLSPLVSIKALSEEFSGRWYTEARPGEVGHLWAAVSNPRSFWLTEASLLRALELQGFPRILRLRGFSGLRIPRELELERTYSRLWCVALKERIFSS